MPVEKVQEAIKTFYSYFISSSDLRIDPQNLMSGLMLHEEIVIAFLHFLHLFSDSVEKDNLRSGKPYGFNHFERLRGPGFLRRKVVESLVREGNHGVASAVKFLMDCWGNVPDRKHKMEQSTWTAAHEQLVQMLLRSGISKSEIDGKQVGGLMTKILTLIS
jgi:hypothetical protein